MTSEIAVPINTRLFLDLAEFLRESGDVRDPADMVSVAVEYWLENAGWKPELIWTREQANEPTRGYQWKSLFLPEGTQIRMQYKGEYHYAKVEGDEIIYNGSPVTPGSLANTVTSSSRNAWRDLWIRRPTDSEWKLSDDCRQESSSSELEQLVARMAPGPVKAVAEPIELATGAATDQVPPSTELTYGARVRGLVTVTLPSGYATVARAFEKLPSDRAPARIAVHVTLNGLSAMLPSSANRPGRGDTPSFCTYFEDGGQTLFFYTHQASLPEGAVVDFARTA